LVVVVVVVVVVVQVGTSKISGCTISLQAAVHPGASVTGTPTLKKKDPVSTAQ
jgi:hypothetical protein